MSDIVRRLCRARRLASLLTLSLGALLALPARSHAQQNRVPLNEDHLPPLLARSQVLQRADPNETLQLALVLPLRNRPQLDQLLQDLYDPHHPLYGRFLTPAQFQERFSPTQTDYDAVLAFAHDQGLRLLATHANRALVDVEAPASVVESAFHLHLLRCQDPSGRSFHAPDAQPSVPVALQGRLTQVIGLDNAGVWHSHNVVQAGQFQPFAQPCRSVRDREGA